MKHQTLLAGAMLLLVPTAGMAADFGKSAKDGGAYYPSLYWNGPYIGASIGFGEGSTDYYLDQDNHGHDSNSAAGLAGSVSVGYNWQRESGFVFGVEADLGFIDAAEEHIWKDYHNFQSDYGTWATIRGRVGYAFDRFLVFATGGFAYMDVDEIMLGAQGGQATNQTSPNQESHYGWVIGGGVEYAYSERISLKADYLHMEFDKFHGTTASANGANNSLDYHFENSLDIVRVGLNYKLQ